MDIRIINTKNEVINVTNLSIKVIKDSLIGIDAAGNIIEIEKLMGSSARACLKEIADLIEERVEEGSESIIFDFRKKEKKEEKGEKGEKDGECK